MLTRMVLFTVTMLAQGGHTQSLYVVKPRFQELLRPLARILAKAGVTANLVTLIACGLSIEVGLLALRSRHMLLLLPPFFLVRMALNAIDGMLAREFGQKSPLGAYLNELGDVVSDCFLYLPFVYLHEFSPVWMVAVIALGVITELAGNIAPAPGASRRYEGPMGKSDRAAVFGVLALWLGAGGELTSWESELFPQLMTGLLMLTVIRRVRGGLTELALKITANKVVEKNMRIARECWFETHDGTRLFYRYWPPAQGDASQAVVLLHRGHEHSGRLQHLVDELNLPDIAMFAWDARGHGLSSRGSERPANLAKFVKDLDCFVRHISSAHGIAVENMAVIAQSVGGVLAAAWAHDFAPRIRCMVLATPAFKVKLYVPFARRALTLAHRLFGDFRVNSYVRAGALTHDPERIASYKADPLIKRPISVRVLLGLYSASDRIVADVQAIHLPTQLLISGRDWVVRRKPQDEFFARLGAAIKEKHSFAGFYHDTLGEKDRSLPIAKAREFIVRMFTQPMEPASLRDAGQTGYTWDEYESLRRPLPRLSLRNLKFAVSRIALRTFGRLSAGIRLGLETGFDSGSSLDYIYTNRSFGITGIGKRIDRFYLNAIGWRGIRTRKHNVERALRLCTAILREEGRPVRVLDIAAGHGRYVLNAFSDLAASQDRILLRDYSEINVRMGKELIRQKGMDQIARFEKGDAFNHDSIAAIWPPPTLSVVSGLYELFADNELVQDSLAGLADAMEHGGYLVYTGQPWHPQLEFIARTLPSHRDQQPWIMRRRTQAELDQLVRDAGFLKIDQYVDEWGMFTVSIARKSPAAQSAPQENALDRCYLGPAPDLPAVQESLSSSPAPV